ncbi:MAG: hypothetical protein AUG49_22955 [Catenulispora sp. 13_1_20CM_3_70_7]|nr:MAG: hypothetical protein AUG49_22955 [Catenulispora sp. 13_1_20CM_3_70_7]
MAVTQPTESGRRGRKAKAPKPADTVQIPRRVWMATLVLLVAAFMELMDVTMANVAIPSIQQDLGASYGQVQWVVAGYALAFSVGLLTGGRLGDIFGRRRMFLAGLIGFMATSAMCALAPNPDVLVTARVLQGLTAAVMLPQVLASISVWFPEEKREAAFGLVGAVSGLGGLTAPLIGGSLINANLFGEHWRPIFMINVPIGLITLIAALKLVDESHAPRRLSLDPVGTLIGGAGVFLVVFPVIQGRDAGWPAWVWVMLAASLPVLALFVAVERAKTRKDGSPLVDLALFRDRSFATALAVTLVFFAGVTAIAFTVEVFLQSGFSYSAFRAGVALVPLAFGLIVGSGLSIGLSQKLGRTVLQVGALVSIGGVLWLASVVGGHTSDLSGWTIVAPLLVTGIGLGLFVAPLNDLVLKGAPPESAGSASGLQSTMIQAGSAIGVAVLGVILFNGIGDGADAASAKTAGTLTRNLVAAGLPGDQAAKVAAASATCFHDQAKATDPTVVPASCAGAPAALPPAARQAVATAATAAVRDDFAGSMKTTLAWDAGVFAAAGALVFLLPKRRRAVQEAAAGN